MDKLKTPILSLFILLFFTSIENLCPELKIINYKFRDTSQLLFNKTLKEPHFNSKDLVLVLFDEKTETEIKSRFPYPRKILTEATKTLLMEHLKIFAFDLVMAGDSETKADDQELANLLLANNTVPLSYVQTNNQVYEVSKPFRPPGQEIGIINKIRDPDGIVRSILPFFFDFKQMKTYYCAESLLALKYWNIPLSSLEQDIENNRLLFKGNGLPLENAYYGAETRLEFKYYYTRKSLPRLSFSDLYFKKFPPGFFKGKIVLMGCESLIHHDTHPTALGIEKGVVLVANTLLTFLNNAFPRPLPWPFQEMFYFLSVFLFLAFSSNYPPPFKDIAFGMGWLALLWLLDYCLFINNVLYDGSVPFFSVIFLMIGRNILFFSQIFIENRKIRNTVLMDHRTGLPQFYYLAAKLKNKLYQSSRYNSHTWLCSVSTPAFSSVDDKETKINIKTLGALLQKGLSMDECLSWNQEKKVFFLLIQCKGFQKLKKRIFARVIEPLMLDMIEHIETRPPFIVSAVELYSLQPKTISNTLKALETAVPNPFPDQTCIQQFIPPNDSIEKTASPLPLPQNGFTNDAEFMAHEIEHSMQSVQELETLLKMNSREIEISERLAAVGKIAAEVAHELKNPLQNLLNMHFFFSKYIPQENPAYKFIEGYKSETDRMLKLCREMLDFSKPHVDFKKTPGDVNQLLETTLHLMEGTFRKKMITVKKDLDQNLGEILIDSSKIQQVLFNMLLNACDAIEKKGTISVSSLLNGGILEIKISDTGMGIPKENIDKIFNLFFTTKGSNGTGVGLSTCFNIIKKHGGRILVDSEMGKGTTFTIILPA